MGWKTRTIMVPTEEKYFQMEIDDICRAISNHHRQNKLPQIVIISEESWRDIKCEVLSSISYCPCFGNDGKRIINICGVRIISSRDIRREDIEVY